MVLSIYAVTYASYGEVDGKLFTDTKLFVDEDKARAYQQENIKCFLEDNNALTDENFDKVKDEWDFEYSTDGWYYKTTLSVQEYEFYLQAK